MLELDVFDVRAHLQLQDWNGKNEVPHFILENDFVMMVETVTLLQPFHEVTVELSAQKNVSESKIIVLVSAWKTSLSTSQFTLNTVNKMASKLLEHLKVRFKSLEGQSVLSIPTECPLKYLKKKWLFFLGWQYWQKEHHWLLYRCPANGLFQQLVNWFPSEKIAYECQHRLF